MAQAITSIPTAAAVTPGAAVAPATTEVVADPSWGTIVEVIVGGTATTITVVRPGNMSAGDAVADYVVGTALTSTSRFFRLGAEYADAAATPVGAATILFSQVTAVTWRIFRT